MGNLCMKARATENRDLNSQNLGASAKKSQSTASISTNHVEKVPTAYVRPFTLSLSFSPTSFTREQLERATNGFSKANFLGEGGFGTVHKGVLDDGTIVAIKQLKADRKQEDRDFQAEVEIISRVHHRHLVTLVGWCIAEGERMLVYEFVPNDTLKFHLHGK